MSALFWLFTATLYRENAIWVLPLVLVTLIKNRNVRVGVALAYASAYGFHSIPGALILLLFVSWSAMVETFEGAYRYFLSACAVLIICLILPGLMPPVLSFVLASLLGVLPFFRRHLVEWRRISLVLLTLGTASFAAALLIRLIKETLFGDVAAWFRPLLVEFGSLFLWTVPLSERVDRQGGQSIDVDNVATLDAAAQASTRTADSSLWLMAGTIIVAVLVIATLMWIRRRQTVGEEKLDRYERAVKVPLRKKTRSHHPLLKVASQLEETFPREKNETTYEWLRRIGFPDGKEHARLIDAIEFSPSEPAYDVQSFRQLVMQQISKK
ncbi:G protein-coupled receptor family protein [Exiguobacterium flavidum]|uniref:hypothetical protein n=1 Tax=Exiguobacterium flavidum TaxID=2184695 RepID=UPI000DF77AD6|nr:hypothetical protein [Exiguobacterium flavidum]